MTCDINSFVKITPCADYPGLSLEGHFQIRNTSDTLQCLRGICNKIMHLSDPDIIYGRLYNGKVYIYNNGKVVLSQLESEESGLEVIRKLIKCLQDRGEGDE